MNYGPSIPGRRQNPLRRGHSRGGLGRGSSGRDPQRDAVDDFQRAGTSGQTAVLEQSESPSGREAVTDAERISPLAKTST